MSWIMVGAAAAGALAGGTGLIGEGGWEGALKGGLIGGSLGAGGAGIAGAAGLGGAGGAAGAAGAGGSTALLAPTAGGGAGGLGASLGSGLAHGGLSGAGIGAAGGGGGALFANGAVTPQWMERASAAYEKPVSALKGNTTSFLNNLRTNMTSRLQDPKTYLKAGGNFLSQSSQGSPPPMRSRFSMQDGLEPTPRQRHGYRPNSWLDRY